MNDQPDARVEKIRAAVREATGSDSPKLSTTVRFLEESGRQFYSGADDLVLYEVYRDETVKGRVRTLACLVIPGDRTLSRCPAAEQFGLHFRKTYTKDSPPISRGETPAVEFQRTVKTVSRIPNSLGRRLLPLGHSEWIYRSRVVPGQTFAALSPFSDLAYEQAVNTPLITTEPQALAHRIESSYAALVSMHETGVAHGDLHLDNVMWIADEPESPVQPIDLASAVFREDVSPTVWTEVLFDDLNELMREAGLLQLNLGRRFSGACAAAARVHADALFTDSIAKLMRPLV